MKSVRAVLIASFLAALLVSCSTTGTNPGTGPSAPSIGSFAAAPASITAGGSSTLSWSVTGKNLTLGIDHGVGDVTGKTSVTVTPSTTTTYTLTATNSAGKATSTAEVTVSPAPVAPSITSFTATPGTVTQGASSTLAWSVTGTGPITLSIDQSVGDVSNTTSTTVTPSATTTYTLTATNGAGSDSAQATVTVTAPTSTTVSVTQSGPVSWVAAQDGSGAWTALSGTSFTVHDASGRYGVAWACTPSSGQPEVFTLQATTADGTSVAAVCGTSTVGTVPPYTISGTVSGIPAGGTGYIALGNGTVKTVTNAQPTFSFTLAAGTYTLVAYGVNGDGTPATMVVDRNVSVTGNDSTFNVDLSTGTSFDLDTVTLSNVPGGASTDLVASAVLPGPESLWFYSGGATTLDYPIVTPAQPGDQYTLQGSAQDANTYEQIMTSLHAPSSPLDLALPPVMPASANVQASGSTATLTWAPIGFTGSGGLTMYGGGVSPNSFSSPSWVALVTQAWAGSATTYTFPDYSSTAGWNNAWNYPTGQTASASISALHTDLGLDTLLSSAFGNVPGGVPDGATVASTSRMWTGTY